MIVWQRPNLLLLDEPTNHLDLATREALAMAINDFDGTVMLVSHDRHLLRAVCEDFWMVGRGVVGPFDGDLDDYQRYLLDESKRLREEAKQAELQQASAAKCPSASAATEATASPDRPARSPQTGCGGPPAAGRKNQTLEEGAGAGRQKNGRPVGRESGAGRQAGYTHRPGRDCRSRQAPESRE